MKQKQVKILGIMLCLLILGTLLPVAAAVNQDNTRTDPRPVAAFAMVMGRLTNVHKVGRFVLAHAVKLHYMGMSAFMNFEMGMIRGRTVFFRDSPRFHMLPLGSSMLVMGRVQRLRVIL